jgi:hypothetical protein
VILIYLVNQKFEFRENSYSDKGRRIGTLIEEGPARWCFHAERSTDGLTAEQLFSIVTELMRLNTRPVAPASPQELSKPPSGHTVPETSSDVL